MKDLKLYFTYAANIFDIKVVALVAVFFALKGFIAEIE